MKPSPRLLLLVLVLAGAAFGVQRWHARQAPPAQAAARYVCPMRCLNRVYEHPGKCPVCHMDLVPFAAAAPAATSSHAGAFSSHGKAKGPQAQPLGYRCPLRYSTQRFDGPGRCPFCTLPLKPYYKPGEAPPRALGERAPWPELNGRTAVYYRPYTVQAQAVESVLRVGGRISADGWHLLAPLPAGENAPPKHALAMLSQAGGGRPVLCDVERVSGGLLSLRPDRKLPGGSLATAELRLPGPQALAVPVEAVREDGARAWVFRQQGGAFEPVAVRLGQRGERFTQVSEGLSAGDVIAGAGVFWVEAQWRLEHPEARL